LKLFSQNRLLNVYVGSKGRVANRRGKTQVPWTHFLADITAEDPIPYLRAQLNWNGTFILDGQVRNTAGGIDRPIRQDALCGASLDAALAASAAIEWECLFWLNFYVQKKF